MKTVTEGNNTYTTFANQQDLIRQLDQPTVEGRKTESHDTDDPDWYGTKSYTEAIKLFKGGDENSYQLVKKLKVEADRRLQDEYHSLRQRQDSVTGFSPIVPNALLGLPKSMHNQKLVNKQVIYRRVFFDRSASAFVNREDLAAQGAYALTYIDYLEHVGKCQFEIWVGSSIFDDWYNPTKHIFMGSKLKRYNELLNSYRYAFDLVNPSFFRRLCFRLYENVPKWVDVTHHSYGFPLRDPKFVQEYLGKDTIVLDSSINIQADKSVEDNFKEIKDAFSSIHKER